jgi:hypothetical protein
MEMVASGQEVVVSCKSTPDRDREQVRAIVRATPTDVAGGTSDWPSVRFRDE